MKMLFAVAMIATMTTSVLAQDEGGMELQSATHNNAGMELPPDFPPQTDLQGIQPVPEPSTFALTGMALGLIAVWRKRRI